MTPGPGQPSRRGSIERGFHALKVGPRIEDRRLEEADDGRPGRAFNAITACRVGDGRRLARERPRRLPGSRGLPDPLTRQTGGVLTAGRAGGCPSPRQPMPGTQTPWPGRQRLKGEVIGDEWGPPAQATD